MKRLPFYKLYPQDFDCDEKVRGLSLSEAGLFLFCLNHAWVNDGLPADPKEIARQLRIPEKEFNRNWRRVNTNFIQCEDSRLRNSRQEEERLLATKKSLKAAESVKARWKTDTNVSETYEVRIENVLPRALARYDSVSVSGSGSGFQGGLGGKSSERFLEFWEAYPMKKNRDKCCQIWLSLVAPADEEKVFACLGRYLDSQLVADGKVQNPENWLHDCVRDGWATEWPPSAAARRRGASVRQQTASVEGQEESKRRALAAYDRADENGRAELRNLWPELWPERIEPHGEEKAEKAPSVRMQRMPR